MGKMIQWMRRHGPSKRRLVQLYAALLYNANLKGFVEGEIYQGGLKALCAPGFNCYSCPGAIAACPLGALQNALNAANHRAPYYVLGILMLFGLTLGRTVCGWLCPLGMMQELLHKIPTFKLRKSRFTRALSYLKYAVLAVFVVALPVWYGFRRGMPLPAFCKYICPAGTFEGAVGLLSSGRNDGLFAALGALFTQKFVILTAVGLACVFCYRSFCRFLCPLGAIYGCFNRLALTGVKVDAHRCNGCGACVRACGMDVRRVGDHECISCGRCVGCCSQNAIALKCGGLTLQGPESGGAKPVGRGARAAFWGVAVALLAFALVWFNVVNPPKPAVAAPVEAAVSTPEPAEVPASDAPLGYEVGNRLPDFTANLIGGGEFRLEDHRGQVVFINLWATYCKPCVGELPYFNRLRAEHPEIEVLAIHNGMITTEDEVVEYLADKGWDELAFTLDSEDGELFAVVNGSSKMPQTVVLNKSGEVIYNEIRSVTYEMLEALYAEASE